MPLWRKILYTLYSINYSLCMDGSKAHTTHIYYTYYTFPQLLKKIFNLIILLPIQVINKYKSKLYITLSLNDHLTISASDGFDTKIIFKNIPSK